MSVNSDHWDFNNAWVDNAKIVHVIGDQVYDRNGKATDQFVVSGAEKRFLVDRRKCCTCGKPETFNSQTESACAEELKRVNFERDRPMSHVSLGVLIGLQRIDEREPNRRCANGCAAVGDDPFCIDCGFHVAPGPIQYARFARLRRAALWAGIVGWGPACAIVSWLIHGRMP